MYHLLMDKGVAIPSDTEYLKSMSSISDLQSINNNCRRGVLVCYTLGLLGGLGDGSFGPQKSMNRAQAAVVIGRLRDYVQGNGGTAGAVEIPSETEPKAPPIAETAPEVTELPEFKLLAGENVDAMMARINAATPAWREGYLVDGNPITDSNISNLLNKFKENFPQGTKWDESDFYRYKASSFGSSAYACSAFASALSDGIFGEDAPLSKHQNFDQLKAGDVVWMKNTENGYNHAFVVISIDRELGTIYTCSGNSGGEVRWDGYTTFEILNRDTVAPITYVYSRY